MGDGGYDRDGASLEWLYQEFGYSKIDGAQNFGTRGWHWFLVRDIEGRIDITSTLVVMTLQCSDDSGTLASICVLV
jgi:hypothetical protein